MPVALSVYVKCPRKGTYMPLSYCKECVHYNGTMSLTGEHGEVTETIVVSCGVVEDD
jgi:hypothetical protein